MSNNTWVMVDEKQKSAWQKTMPFFLEDPHVISWNQISEKIKQKTNHSTSYSFVRRYNP